MVKMVIVKPGTYPTLAVSRFVIVKKKGDKVCVFVSILQTFKR